MHMQERKRKIILLNGCPSSGKDTIANYLVEKHGFKTIAFKDQVYKDVIDYFGVTQDEYMALYNDRTTKDLPTPLLNGYSPRSAMQYVVEQVNKPKLGKDYLAKYTLDIILEDVYNDYVVSDLGLDEEEEATHKKLNNKNYKIIYIDRDGYDFSKDTRSKRNHIDFTIYNNDTLDILFTTIDNYIKTI